MSAVTYHVEKLTPRALERVNTDLEHSLLVCDGPSCEGFVATQIQALRCVVADVRQRADAGVGIDECNLS